MKLSFHTKKLARQCESDRSRTKAFGAGRAKVLRRRLTALLAAASLEDLRHAPGRLRELKFDHAGHLSLDLDGPYRLLFEPVLDAHQQPAASANVPWSQLIHVRILCMEDTHD